MIQVDVAKDLHFIKVFWLAGSDVVDDAIDNALSDAAPRIRLVSAALFNRSVLLRYIFRAKLLSQQIFGVIPTIKFVRDVSSLRVEEIERLFATADYGMDYRAVSQTAATLGSVSDAPQSTDAPPWVRRFKDRQGRKTDERDRSDTSRSNKD